MLSKKFLKQIASASLFVGIAIPAFADPPLYQFDETSSVSALCSASMTYNDNIYLEHAGKDSDVIWTISPGIEFLKGGESSESSFRVTYTEDLIMYSDNSKNDSQDAHVEAVYSFAGSKLKASVAVGFDQYMNTTNRDAVYGKLIRYHRWYGRALGTYDVTEKISVMSGFKYYGQRYDNSRNEYNDRESYAIPLNIYHSVLTEKIKAGLSYEYRYTDVASNRNNRSAGKAPGYQEVHFIGLTATGDFTEALTLDGRIGYTSSQYHRRTINHGNDSSNTLGMALSAAYKASEKTLATLLVSREFEIAGDANSITSTGAQVGLLHTFTSRLTGDASFAYRQDDYDESTRCDDVYTVTVGARYSLNEYLALSASYSFQWNDSNRTACEYTDNKLTLALHFRY